MGRICRQKSDYKQALELLRERLTPVKLGDQLWEADNLGKLGILYSDLGQYEDSIEHYQLSLQRLRRKLEIKDRKGNSG